MKERVFEAVGEACSFVRSVFDRDAWEKGGRWRNWSSTWGVSLAFHAVLLALLTLIVYAGSLSGDAAIDRGVHGQLFDDVTSLYPADRAGDPFTHALANEPVSIGADSNSDESRIADMRERPIGADFRIDVPEALNIAPVPLNSELTGGDVGRGFDTKDMNADESKIGSGAANAAGSGKTKVKGKGRAGLAAIGSQRGFGGGGLDVQGELNLIRGPSVPFSGRSGELKAKLVRSQGGSVESEKAVELGLDWIVRHQAKDGHWSLDTSSQCRSNPCPERRSMESDTAATGLALLPLLGAGHTHAKKSRYQVAIRRGLDWLMKRQKRDGMLFEGGGRNSGMYSHAIATLAITEAYGLTGDKRLLKPAQDAVDYILDAQNLDDGGWRYVPGMPGDTSVFGWQMFVLRSAALAKLKVSKNAIVLGGHYLDLAAADPNGVTYSYMPGRRATPTMTAEALLARQYFGWSRDNPSLLKGAGMLLDDLRTSDERNIYYWYYATQMIHNLGGKEWQTWNAFIRDKLTHDQVTKGACAKGSWDPAYPQFDEWGRLAGRLYVTSMSILTLEVYYRYLPLYDDQSSFAGPRPGNEPQRGLEGKGKADAANSKTMKEEADGDDEPEPAKKAEPAMKKSEGPKPPPQVID